MEAAAPSPSDQLPPERIQEMRKAIHQHLQQSNVFNQIRDIIDSHAADHADFDPANPQHVMGVLRERGLVQEILGRLGSGGAAQSSFTSSQNVAAAAAGGTSSSSSRRSFSLVPGNKYLHIRVLGGRAFLDNLDADPATLATQQMVLSMHFGHQRFRCTPQECLVDPLFDDDFLVEMDPRGPALLDITTPLNIVVTKEDCSLAKAKVVGENTVEWRKVLKTGFLGLTVELAGENPGVPSGIIELQMEVIPGGPRTAEDEIVGKMQIQKAAITAADREFLIYARRWWSEFHALRPSHQERKVKVFAATAGGRMVPSTHFVSVLQPDRVLDTPYAAARFVSLLALSSASDADASLDFAPRGTAAGDVWPSPLTFLSQRRGEVCNHATLLCSLLLGFGLDAYCVVGTTTQGKTHMFVATRRRVGGPAEHDYEVVFWEPSTGIRAAQASGQHSYLTIGSCFNHTSFFANVQASDNAVTALFDFGNEEQWKQLDALKLRMVPKFPNPPLLWIPIDARRVELDIEGQLRTALSQQREAEGLRTAFDDSLAFALSQSLTAYEAQRVTGIVSNDDLAMFQQCVKGKIGDGKTFRGLPLNTSHISARKILASFNGTPSGRELLTVVGEDLRFAVRVKVTVYPESVVSVWVMLAAYYRAAM
jgi:centrosomal protein CEP76